MHPAGARGYIVKDIERFSLRDSIRAVHRGAGAVSPTIAAAVLDRLRVTHAAPKRTPSMPLSETQLGIVRLIAQGFTNREIGEHLHLSENTIKSHIQEIFRKLDVSNRVAQLEGQ